MAHRPTTTPHDNSSGMARTPSSATQSQATQDRAQLPYLRNTNHPELPEGEIQFRLIVSGAGEWSWADIRNNGAVVEPESNPHNERTDSL